MDPYAYVSGNPETFIDPIGHNEFGAGGDEAVAGYAEYVPYVDDEEEAEQFGTRIEETGSRLTETSGELLLQVLTPTSLQKSSHGMESCMRTGGKSSNRLT
ncbi:MAG TPA: hypothetical protein VFV38_32825 [Ktedonobacteraceae bacterium]|nr:hypothetical protein [Ktedonobacteraceae bacterium]